MISHEDFEYDDGNTEEEKPWCPYYNKGPHKEEDCRYKKFLEEKERNNEATTLNKASCMYTLSIVSTPCILGS